jgi:hypothetical protein
MWPTTQGFKEALESGSRLWSTRIEVLFGSDVVTSLDTLVSGYVGMDNVSVRRECNFTIVDADGIFTPASAGDLLSPKGTEIRLYRGLMVNHVYEYVPMGVFGIDKPEVRSHSDGTVIEIRGYDRVDALRYRQFEDPWVVVGGTLAHVAIAAIFTDRMPGIPMRITPSTYTVPEVVFDRLSDPWDAIRKLAVAAGLNCYFDQLGSFVIEPTQDFITGWTYQPGPASMLMTSARSFSARGSYSGVIARAEHPDAAPIRYELWDTNPASPTYSAGPFGRRPYGYYTDKITSLPQLQDIAQIIYDREVHIAQECEITVTGHPGHDVGDIIEIIDPRSRTAGVWRVISATVPMKVVQGDHVRLRCQEVR